MKSTLFSVLISFLFAVTNPLYAIPLAIFNLQSGSFKNQDSMPKRNTCDGQDESPALTWSLLPGNTRTLALIFSDLDAPGGTFYHWVLYNMPPNTKKLPAGFNVIPPGASVAKNSWGKMQYNGPCPPKGSTHSYVFTLYALDTRLSISPDADAGTVIEAMQHHILDKTQLSVSYGR